VLNHIEFAKKSSPNYWTVVFKRSDQDDSSYTENYDLVLNSTQNATVHILVRAVETAQRGNNESVVIEASARNSTFSRELTFNITVVGSVLTTSLGLQENSAFFQHAEMARERPVDPKAMGFCQIELFRIVEQ